eukprot:4392-Heterococcus_DN1.PRE.4
MSLLIKVYDWELYLQIYSNLRSTSYDNIHCCAVHRRYSLRRFLKCCRLQPVCQLKSHLAISYCKYKFDEVTTQQQPLVLNTPSSSTKNIERVESTLQA